MGNQGLIDNLHALDELIDDAKRNKSTPSYSGTLLHFDSREVSYVTGRFNYAGGSDRGMEEGEIKDEDIADMIIESATESTLKGSIHPERMAFMRQA
ncbi:hypothetical protein LTR66_016994 [Elasticomyces elasticus]|nr:hypothetical protein LTR66_016994 [Elasticomyces elasticus]